jgi:hypothetical protein
MNLIGFRVWGLMILAIVLLVSGTAAQSLLCKIGTTEFTCPKYFKAVKVSDPTISLFKYTESDGNPLYFFAATSSEAFDPTTVGKAVLALTSPSAPAGKWKPVVRPLIMSTQTKYKYDLAAFMGLSSVNLVEIKSFT